MTVERADAGTPLDREKRELFDKATTELAGSIAHSHVELTQAQRRGIAERTLDKRWSIATRDYRSIVASLSLPAVPEYSHDEKAFAEQKDMIQMANVSRLRHLWDDLRELFSYGTLTGGEQYGEGHLSKETAQELVAFLAKSHKYR